jgi:carbonic anhydrase
MAGHATGADVVGSLDFSTQDAGAKLAVVIGHTQCGAITGARAGVAHPENLKLLLKKLVLTDVQT